MSIEKAIRRAAEYDAEKAKAMTKAHATSVEGMWAKQALISWNLEGQPNKIYLYFIPISSIFRRSRFSLTGHGPFAKA